MKAKALIMEAEDLNKEQLLRLIRKPKVWIGIVGDRDGYTGNVYASRTKDGLEGQIARYCIDHWDEDDMGPVPDYSRETISTYYTERDGWWESGEAELSDTNAMTIWVAVLNSMYDGYEFLASDTNGGLLERIADWCREGWGELVGNEPPPEDPATLIGRYFDSLHGEETVHIKEVRLR